MPGAPCICRPSQLTVQPCDAVQCSAEVQVLGAWPSLPPPRPYRFATGIIWHCFASCAAMQMFSAEELLSFLTRFRKRGSLSEVFLHFQTPPRVHFLLGFLTTCGQRFIYPDVRNRRNEQSPSKGALDFPWNPMWRPRISLCFSCKYF